MIRRSKNCLGSTIRSSEVGSNIMGGFTARRSTRSRANWTESWSVGPSVNTKSYAPMSVELGTGSRAFRVVVQSCLLTGSWHVAWLHDGSRMTRECPVRFCERLGVKLPGATLPANSVWPIATTSRLIDKNLSREAVGLLPAFRSRLGHRRSSLPSIPANIMARTSRAYPVRIRRPYAHELDLQYEGRHDERSEG